MVVPADIHRRLDEYCAAHGRTVIAELGFGVDGYIWRTDADRVVKVHRPGKEFQQELVVTSDWRLGESTVCRDFRFPSF